MYVPKFIIRFIVKFHQFKNYPSIDFQQKFCLQRRPFLNTEIHQARQSIHLTFRLFSPRSHPLRFITDFNKAIPIERDQTFEHRQKRLVSIQIDVDFM